ncbi:MAG TPA: hypothetical protein VMF60_09880, partial [Acidimicrobiales bacterium]|nr:hypothetical protein [Acidimicrobiales bacterium]
MTDQRIFSPADTVSPVEEAPSHLPPPPVVAWRDDEATVSPARLEVPTTRKRRVRRGDRWRWERAGVVVTGVGVLLLLFFAYLYVFTPLTYARDQHRLLQGLVGSPRSVYRLVAGKLPPEG